MKPPKMRFANLDESSLKRIQEMEEAMGTIILAMEPHHPLADLTVEQLAKVKALEEELGVVLVAFRV